jgi:hypothetical protein
MLGNQWGEGLVDSSSAIDMFRYQSIGRSIRVLGDAHQAPGMKTPPEEWFRPVSTDHLVRARFTGNDG